MDMVGRRYDDQGDGDDVEVHPEDDDDDDVDACCKNPLVFSRGQTTAALLRLIEWESLLAPSWGHSISGRITQREKRGAEGRATIA